MTTFSFLPCGLGGAVQAGLGGLRGNPKERFPYSFLSFAFRTAVCLFLCLPLIGAGEGAKEDSSYLERFKAFVASPPVIESLVYRMKLPPNEYEAPSLDVGLKLSTNYTHYHARWQANAFALREIPSLSDLNNLKIYHQAAFSFAQGQWILESTFDRVATFWYDGSTSSQHNVNPVHFVTESLRDWLSVVMNMGVHHLRPGTIRWSGNTFHSESHLRQIRVEGTLRASDMGVPLALEVVYRDTDALATHIIRYSYGTNLGLTLLPTQIRDFLIYENREVELGEITLVSLKTNSTPLQAQWFDPTPFIAWNKMRIQHYTNGTLYSVNHGGKLTPISISAANPASSGEIARLPVLSYALVYALFVLASIVFVVLVRSAYRKERGKSFCPAR